MPNEKEQQKIVAPVCLSSFTFLEIEVGVGLMSGGLSHGVASDFAVRARDGLETSHFSVETAKIVNDLRQKKNLKKITSRWIFLGALSC